jgi:cytochrome c556
MPQDRRLTAAVLLLAAGALPASLSAAMPEDAVDYRQGAMEVFSWNLTRMGAMVKGETPFDAAAFKGYAAELAGASAMNVLQGFPEDSVSDESDAKDEIWLNWSDFETKYKALKEAAAKLSQVAAGGDEAAMREQFKETAAACKACHKEYKK